MNDRDTSIRSAVHAATDHNIQHAQQRVDDCALPRPQDVRRLLALQDVMGDIAAGLARGHTDLSAEWLNVASIAQDAVEGSLVEAARRPITLEDFTGDASPMPPRDDLGHAWDT